MTDGREIVPVPTHEMLPLDAARFVTPHVAAGAAEHFHPLWWATRSMRSAGVDAKDSVTTPALVREFLANYQLPLRNC
jgi:hypothetical protein